MNRTELTTVFVEHLEHERNLAGLTQTQMAEKMDLSLSGYKKIISGETYKIDLYTAYRLSLFTGKSISEFLDDIHSDLSDIIEKMRKLSPLQLNFVSTIVDFETAFLDGISPGASSDYVTLFTPTGALRDGMIWDTAHMEKINVSHYRRIFGSQLHCAMRITSDHLHPVYGQNDILLISKKAPRDGDTVIFIHSRTHRCYLRRFRQTMPWTLEPINSYGIPLTIDTNDPCERNNWIIFGKVLTKMRLTSDIFD